MKTLVVLVVVLVVFRLVRPLLILNQLLRLRIWKPRPRLASEEEIPAYVRDGLREPIDELVALGFERHGWSAMQRERPQGDAPRFVARLVHPATGTHAAVTFSTVPDSAMPCTVTLTTYGADGRVLRTFHGGERSSLGEPPGTLVNQPFAPTVTLQLQSHAAAVSANGLTPAPLDPDTLFARNAERQAAHFESLVARGALRRERDGSYVMSWGTALPAARAVLRAMRRIAAQRVARVRMVQAALRPLPVIPIEEDVAAYHRQLEVTSGRPRPSFLLALFLVTVPLFVLGARYSAGATTTAAVLLAIVLFHELGHYLAMRTLGYVDTTIFFVPFLGGVAAGRKDDATIAQRMIVLLAGPVPGLLLACAFAVVGPRSWGRETAFLVAAVNLFNLLPMLPLDGGQIAHMLFFARRPWLDTASRGIAGLGLLAVGFFTSGVFLGVLGGLTLWQLPKTRQRALLRRQFFEARARNPGEEPVRLFFQVLRTSPLVATAFGEKVVLARATLAHADEGAPMGWGKWLGWLSGYAGAFALGCVAVALTLGRDARATVAAKDVEPTPIAALSCAAPAGATQGAVRSARSFALLAGVATFDGSDAITPRSHVSPPRRRGPCSGRSVPRSSCGRSLPIWGATRTTSARPTPRGSPSRGPSSPREGDSTRRVTSPSSARPRARTTPRRSTTRSRTSSPSSAWGGSPPPGQRRASRPWRSRSRAVRIASRCAPKTARGAWARAPRGGPSCSVTARRWATTRRRPARASGRRWRPRCPRSGRYVPSTRRSRAWSLRRSRRRRTTIARRRRSSSASASGPSYRTMHRRGVSSRSRLVPARACESSSGTQPRRRSTRTSPRCSRGSARRGARTSAWSRASRSRRGEGVSLLGGASGRAVAICTPRKCRSCPFGTARGPCTTRR